MSALPMPGGRRRLPGIFLRGASDERLVARVRQGDEAAFEAIFDRHHRPLLAFCRHMLGTREEGEDAVQHTFVSAYRALQESDTEIQLKPWLYAIARNRCLSMIRARREEVALDDHVFARSSAGLAAEVEQRADLRELLGDIGRLPEDQRAALVLSELGALSHDEIAAALEVRREKVKALVFQARESLAAARAARDTPCHEIREQLTTLTGGALRRASLRRHLDTCEGCRAFRDDVKRQRAGMAVLLPVLPTAGLKGGVLGSVFGTSAATAGSIVSAGLLSGAAVKVAATLVVAGAIGGGVAAERHAVGGGASVERATPATPATPASQTGERARRATPGTPPGHAKARRRHGAAGAHGGTNEHAAGGSSGSHANGGKSATSPGHLKAQGAPAAGKALGKSTAPGHAGRKPEHPARPEQPAKPVKQPAQPQASPPPTPDAQSPAAGNANGADKGNLTPGTPQGENEPAGRAKPAPPALAP